MVSEIIDLNYWFFFVLTDCSLTKSFVHESVSCEGCERKKSSHLSYRRRNFRLEFIWPLMKFLIRKKTFCFTKKYLVESSWHSPFSLSFPFKMSSCVSIKIACSFFISYIFLERRSIFSIQLHAISAQKSVSCTKQLNLIEAKHCR